MSSLGVAWVVCWAFGAQLVSGAPIASMSAAHLAIDEVRAVQDGIRDRARFADEIRHDRYRATPGDRLLTGLRGKDVLLVFVESYGKVAVEGRPSRRGSMPCSTRGPGSFKAAGFSARSGWLTSPTFGGISWLAHSTLQAGVWVNSKGRYDQLIGSDRFTLSQAFRRAGWRTVDEVPSNDRDWPQGIVVLPLRPDLRPAECRVPRPHLRVRVDARPVRAAGPPATRAGEAPTAGPSSPRSTWCRATPHGRASRR